MLQPAAYLELRVPIIVQSIAPSAASTGLRVEVSRSLERMRVDESTFDRRWPAILENLSVHGAFVHGDAPPLGGRVWLYFNLAGYGPVHALGWTVWRRPADIRVHTESGAAVISRGFGVVFEWLEEDVRHVIEDLLRGPGEAFGTLSDDEPKPA